MRQKLVLVVAVVLSYNGGLCSAFSRGLPQHRRSQRHCSGDIRQLCCFLPLNELQYRRRRSTWHPHSSLMATRDTNDDDVISSSWSRKASNTKEGRRGVRSRVLSVLASAKNRTGIRNRYSSRSSSSPPSQASIIADAASIGGIDSVSLEMSTDSATASEVNGKTTSNSEDWLESRAETLAQPNGGQYSASAYSPPVQPLPRNYSEVDAFRGDVSAAFSLPPDPHPFTLPKLTHEQEQQLRRGERIQYQSDMGRQGSGFVVVDVNAPEKTVWDCLLDFPSYPDTIPTVRDIKMYTSTHLKQDYHAEAPINQQDGKITRLRPGVPSVTRAAFTLSKFRLNIAAIHKYYPHELGDYMIFTLDPACTNLVLQAAKGVWHTQSDPYGDGSCTRVWLLCELKVSRLLPKFIVDYAAKRAMPRATTWLKPQVEAASTLWLKDRPNGFHEGQ